MVTRVIETVGRFHVAVGHSTVLAGFRYPFTGGGFDGVGFGSDLVSLTLELVVKGGALSVG